jgi:hypothetical protein
MPEVGSELALEGIQTPIRAPRPPCGTRILEISSYSLLGCLAGMQIKLVFSRALQYIFQSGRSRVWQAACLNLFMTINQSEKDKEKDQEWLKLCELVAREQDPQRLSDLVDQLIKKLDARRRELRSGDELANQSKPKNN